MTQPIVLVIFYSCSGSTEKAALAAAVGAVQGRALIRLRRLPDTDPGTTETLARMRKEYVPPTEADLLAVDGIIVGVPENYKFELLERLRSAGKLEGKVVLSLDLNRPADQGRDLASRLRS